MKEAEEAGSNLKRKRQLLKVEHLEFPYFQLSNFSFGGGGGNWPFENQLIKAVIISPKKKKHKQFHLVLQGSEVPEDRSFIKSPGLRKAEFIRNYLNSDTFSP